jgi:phage terminase large subunit
LRERRVTLPYKPRPIFIPFHERTQRFAIGVARRRAGKTVACVNDVIKRAYLSPLPNYRASYIAPFKGQAKDVAWEYLKRYSMPLWDKYKPNENELYVRLFNDARIKILGADNEDSLRGGYLDDVVLDEYADMSPTIWSAIIRPMLTDRKGTATFIGTPKGRNSFFKLFQTAQSDPNWFWFILKASETPLSPEDEAEIADARRDMTPEQYAQEFECSFDAAIVGAYYGKEMTAAQEEGRIRVGLTRVPESPMHTAWDFGNGLNMAVWAFQVGERGPLIHDFIQMSGAYFEDYLKECNARGYDGFNYVPHDAKVPSFETGRTRIETMLAYKRKLPPNGPLPPLSVDDGINAVKLMLPRCQFNAETCEAGIEALRQYVQEWDEKARVYKKTPKHDWASHAADALRYLAMAWREMKTVEPPEPKPLFIPTEELTIGQWMKYSRREGKRERA